MLRVLLALADDLTQAQAQIAAIEDMIETADGAKAFLLHVFENNPEGGSVQDVEAVRKVKDSLESAGVSVELLESSGDPAGQVLKYAEEHDVDQICIGGRKRSPAGKALFGSIAQDVVLGTNRPVLLCGSTGE